MPVNRDGLLRRMNANSLILMKISIYFVLSSLSASHIDLLFFIAAEETEITISSLPVVLFHSTRGIGPYIWYRVGSFLDSLRRPWGPSFCGLHIAHWASKCRIECILWVPRGRIWIAQPISYKLQTFCFSSGRQFIPFTMMESLYHHHRCINQPSLSLSLSFSQRSLHSTSTVKSSAEVDLKSSAQPRSVEQISD